MGISLFAARPQTYEVTIFQTPEYGQKIGYQEVYRMNLEAAGHIDAMHLIFGMFNVKDRVPKDYKARFIATGDILLIDERKRGQTFYKLFSGGWKKISRMQVR